MTLYECKVQHSQSETRLLGELPALLYIATHDHAKKETHAYIFRKYRAGVPARESPKVGFYPLPGSFMGGDIFPGGG